MYPILKQVHICIPIWFKWLIALTSLLKNNIHLTIKLFKKKTKNADVAENTLQQQVIADA